jgi:serine/threonine protein phosphatase 1
MQLAMCMVATTYFATMHEHIRDYHQLMHSGRDAELIHVGDYIDGGAHSREVIDRLMSGLGDFQMTCLLGNHEAMLLECLATDNRQAWYTWLSNGGEETLASFGMSLRFGGYDPHELYASVGERREKQSAGGSRAGFKRCVRG